MNQHSPHNEHQGPSSPAVEIVESAVGRVGEIEVRRALPRRTRRMIGPWCFVDHMGPATVGDGGLGVAPHPHIGLQTVTWLLAGEVLHRDSLGTEQVIVPGQLNLMTAGHGVSHSEEGTGYRGEVHGVQLWVAQPDRTRHDPPAFEHHKDLPLVGMTGGTATVLVGEFAGALSPARRDSDHVGVDLDLRSGTTTFPVHPEHEHGLVVLSGSLRVGAAELRPGQLAAFETGHDELTLVTQDATRVLLVGGVPFGERVLMWWNYVARSREEIVVAHRDWTDDSGRFGHVNSRLPRIETEPPPWRTSE